MTTESKENVSMDSTEDSSQKPVIKSSRIPGFAKLDPNTRVKALIERGILTEEDMQLLRTTQGLPLDMAESFIENCLGTFSLPLGIATNFLIDGKEYFIPMAVEESSVVAAACHGAKMTRNAGGFTSLPLETIATCQIELKVDNSYDIKPKFYEIAPQLKQIASECHPRLIQRGGGVKDVELRQINPGHYVVHIHVDTREAMGANIVNTIAEKVGGEIPKLLPCRVGLRILTNLVDKRVSRVSCEVLPEDLNIKGVSKEEAVDLVVEAWEFANLDPYRAATHNKGTMNGIDPVVIATGNDWRAVEAGAHAFAAMGGSYKPLTRWFKGDNGNLHGEIACPIAVGTVGGVTRLNPSAQLSLKILGNPSSAELSNIMATVGLAQNLSAIRALSSEGIQRGHMSLHEKNLEMMRRYDHMPELKSISEDKEKS